MRKTIVYIIVAVIAYFIISRMLCKHRWLKFLHELGMNIADKFTYDELKTAYIYLHDYVRKYKDKAAQMLSATNPELYQKAKQLSIKYKIFNL